MSVVIPGAPLGVDYEEKALESLQKGDAAEAQVWATLHQAEALSVVSARLESLTERLI